MAPVGPSCSLGYCLHMAQMLKNLCEASPGGISCWPVHFYCLGTKLLYSLILNKCHWLIHHGLWQIPSQSSGEVLPDLGSSLLYCILSVMCKLAVSSSRGSVPRHWSKHVPSYWYLVTDGRFVKEKKTMIHFVVLLHAFLKLHWENGLELTSLNLVLFEMERFYRWVFLWSRIWLDAS